MARLSTMGMFIIDTFRFLDPATGQDLGSMGLSDQIGGGGCYFAVGARVFLPPAQLQMIIDRGCDWRPSDQAVLDCFDRTPSEPTNGSTASMWHYRSRPDGTTRAVNIYRGEHRGFDYLSAKIRLEPSDLLKCSPSSPPKLPEWIHLICSPERALETIAQIDTVLGEGEGDDGARFPKLVYEPIPDSCVFENLDECLKVLPRLEVFSPNHEEAAALLGLESKWDEVRQQGSLDAIVEFITSKLAGGFVRLLGQHRDASDQVDSACGPIICIRSGAWGSVVGRAGVGFWHIPAWHTPSAASSQPSKSPDTSSDRIKDVTGAGNSFLGGFSAALVQSDGDSSLPAADRMKQAAIHGAISASLVIEQLGLPDFDVEEGKEIWNGHTAAQRLRILQDRLAIS